MNRPLHETYLRWGRAALDYCKWTFVIGASNKHDDIERTGGWSGESVDRLRETPPISFHDMVQKAEAARCGNCGEQAASAFEYLRTRLGVRPLDYMLLNPSRRAIHNWEGGVCDGDHVFVLIGRAHGSDTDRKTWDLESVVCDPWAGVVCPAFEYSTKGVCGFGWHPTISRRRVN